MFSCLSSSFSYDHLLLSHTNSVKNHREPHRFRPPHTVVLQVVLIVFSETAKTRVKVIPVEALRIWSHALHQHSPARSLRKSELSLSGRETQASKCGPIRRRLGSYPHSVAYFSVHSLASLLYLRATSRGLQLKNLQLLSNSTSASRQTVAKLDLHHSSTRTH